MFRILLCVTARHDWTLVAIAAVVCAVASLATFYLYAKTPSSPAWRRWTWLGLTGLVAGSGIWTTHFVAMLAFKTGLPTGYAAAPTLGSLAVAIVGTALGFAVSARSRGLLTAVIGGLIVGGSITLMHYLGMSGYRTAGRLDWDLAYVGASVVIGAVFGAAAVALAPPGAGLARRLTAGGLLTLGIVGMHFTGMTAVTIVPDPRIVAPASLLSDPAMAAIAVGVAALILITVLVGIAFDTASRQGNLRRLREALDAMPDGIAFYDPDDRLVAWNSKYADLCESRGSTAAVGLAFIDILTRGIEVGAFPEAIGREAEWMAGRCAAHAGEIDNLVQRQPGGAWLRVTERHTADGGVVSSCVDITELKLAEAAMAESRDAAEELARRAEAAEAIAGLGHWRLDAKTREVTWSKELYRIYGFEPGSPLDLESVMAMTHPDDRDESRETLARQLAEGGSSSTGTRIVRAGGEIRHLSGNSRAEFGPDGRVVAVIGTLVDVTEQQLAEARLRAAQADAEAAAAVKAEFLANMSHELRTPLTSIIGFTGLAVEQPELAELTRTYIERVHDASQALLCTVNDILDFSKLEAGQVAIHPQPVALSKLSRATLELFTPQAGAKDLQLSLDDAGSGPDLVVAVDPDRVRQILLNFVSNAVKFTASGGVTLKTTYDAAAQVLAVEVIDTGGGIDEAKQALLFKRFSQIDGSLTRTQGGTGLGLAICKGLVEAMGGEIGLDSDAGKGSRFWFRIPAPPATLAANDADAAALTRPAFEGVRVLVVDDHPTNRELARLFLAGVGAEVSEAEDGEEAVELAGDWPFDVILMDLRMPKLDGAGALKRIRASGGPNDATPILAFTADATADLAERLLADGFDDIVAKPLEPNALLGAVARATAFTEPAEQGYADAV